MHMTSAWQLEQSTHMKASFVSLSVEATFA